LAVVPARSIVQETFWFRVLADAADAIAMSAKA
jgi:hypothetical protein